MENSGGLGGNKGENLNNNVAINWLDAILKISRSEGTDELDFMQTEVVHSVKFSQENERKATD